jgi:hypothetical protein
MYASYIVDIRGAVGAVSFVPAVNAVWVIVDILSVPCLVEDAVVSPDVVGIV